MKRRVYASRGNCAVFRAYAATSRNSFRNANKVVRLKILAKWFVVCYPSLSPPLLWPSLEGCPSRYTGLLDDDIRNTKQRQDDLLDCQWGNAIYLVAPVPVLLFSYEPIIRELDNVALHHL